MIKSLLQSAQEKDPRRGFACAYCDDAYRDALCALVVFDTEIWSVHSRAGEMAQFRLQFWADKITQYPDLQPFDDASNALLLLLQKLTKDDLLLYIDKHFDFISDNKAGRVNIWQQYFTLCAKLCNHGNQYAYKCAEIIINAIDGNFTENQQLINELSNEIRAHGKMAIYINDLLVLRLMKAAKYFYDISDDAPRKLGLFAQLQLFGGRLFNKL